VGLAFCLEQSCSAVNAALQNRLTAGTVTMQSHLLRRLFIQVCCAATPMHCSTDQGQNSFPTVQGCSAIQAHSMLVPLQLHLWSFALSIAASTSSYLDANNSFAQFQQKLIKKASKSHEHFTVSEALSKWKEFAVECELGKSPNKDELVEGLTLLLGTPLLTENMVEKIRRRNAWWGWRLRVKPLSDDEVSDTEGQSYVQQ